MEDGAVEQGDPADPVGDVPRPPEPAAGFIHRAGLPGACVEKPVHGREGADIRLLAADEAGTGGNDRIYQAACKLPVFDGMHAVIGSWVVAGKSAGIGMREDTAPITTNASRFVPHYFAKWYGPSPRPFPRLRGEGEQRHSSRPAP